MIIVYAINHPEAIIRLPQWDEDELALMRYLHKLGSRYITRDKNGDFTAWLGEPRYDEHRGVWVYHGFKPLMELECPPEGFLAHLRPGECVKLEEVVQT